MRRVFVASWAVCSAIAIVSPSRVATAKSAVVLPVPRAMIDDAPRTRVFVERTHVEGDLPVPDRAVVDAALRRGLASSGSTVLPDAERCTTRACRSALERDREGAHKVELSLVAGSRTYVIELRAYRPDESEPYATTTGHCDICGLAELEQLVLARADSLRQRLARDESASTGSAATPRPRREVATSGVKRVFGGVTLGLGLGALAGGIALLAIDGREIASRCGDAERDLDGDCRWIHRTTAGGVAMTVAGVALATAGATLLIFDRRDRDRRYALRATVSPRHASLAIAF